MSSIGTTGRSKVWDLADASTEQTVRRRGTDLGGPVAAVLGVIAFAAAAAPGIPVTTRWCLVAAAGSIAVLVGFSAMRRRQALLSLLLAVAGLLIPMAAGAVTVAAAMRAPATVQSAVVPDRMLQDPPGGLRPSAAFSSLPTAQQRDAAAFATAVVLRIRTLHGSFGPYPTSLVLADGSVVEGQGRWSGMSLGAVPADSRVVYTVSRTGDAFRVTVVSTLAEDATVTASSSLVTAAG